MSGLLHLLLLVTILQSATAASRLSRTNLLMFHNKEGDVYPVRSKADWELRKAEVLRGMQEVMGPLPGKEKRCPLDVVIHTETNCGPYIQRLISYASEPGSRVPAYLLIPAQALKAGSGEFPTVLALHSTDAQQGHRVLVENLRSQYRAFARELAERGNVVLAPAYPHLANYTPDLQALGYRSGTMKAIWDNIRGLDLLESMRFVRKGRFAALGHSLGGHNAIYTAVFDPRIQVVISSCGFDSYLDYMGGDIKGWTSERYMPEMAKYSHQLEEIPFDFHEMIGTLAPRRVFVNAPLKDTNFRADSVDRVLSAARQIYELYGATANLTVEHPDCGHDFPAAVREKAYATVDTSLKPN